MKKTFIALAAALSTYGAYGRVKHGQSVPSFFLEKGMRALGYKDRIRVPDPDHFTDAFEQAPDRDTFPARLLRVTSSREFDVAGMQVFSWNEEPAASSDLPIASPSASEQGERSPAPVILYLHGGGYVYRASKLHYAMVNRVAKLCGARVVFPTYGLGPKHRVTDVLPQLVELYRVLVAQHGAGKIVLMGDSAGGGLVVTLLQALTGRTDFCEALPMPAHAILLSPWVNLAMDHEQTPYYDAVEPMISLAGSLRAARCWVAEGMALNDPLVSPLYADPADLQGFPPVTTFVGTHELLFPDIRSFDAVLERAGVTHSFIAAPRMIHVYPVFPTPEGRAAQQQIAQIINEATRG